MSTDYEPKFGAALPPDQMIQKYHSTDPHEGVDVRCDDGCGQDWRIHRMTFDEWWEDFVAEHDDWKYATSEALRRAAFQAGVASRDAEVVKLKDDNEYLYVAAIERDQLREQVVMLRDVLEITHELYVQASSGYGFARPENPHNYRPDIDCCSKEEIAAHSKACDDYANGRNISGDSWGIGTYNDEYKPAIEALAATEPKHDL